MMAAIVKGDLRYRAARSPAERPARRVLPDAEAAGGRHDAVAGVAHPPRVVLARREQFSRFKERPAMLPQSTTSVGCACSRGSERRSPLLFRVAIESDAQL